MKNYNYCNNCGQNTHAYYQCKHPILSVGVIAFRVRNNEIQYLMICRKDSLGYVDFIRGKYSVIDKSYLENIISEMTNSEKERLLKSDFDSMWSELWCNFSGIQYRGEQKTANDKFRALKNGVLVNETVFSLEELIKKSESKWVEPEWGFPKGKRNFRESDQECALREWEEETGIPSTNITIMNNIIPYEEIFTGSNFKSYKHRYFVGNIANLNIDLTNFQESEVSKVKWMNYDDAIKSMRNYNLEKKEVLFKLNKVLEKYTLYL